MLFLLFLACFLFVVYLVRHPLLRVAGNFWVVDDGPVASDAIVILGNDNYEGDRATRAAEVLRAGWAPRIIASGRYLRPYASIAQLEQHDLLDRGVPASAIVLFAHRAADTQEEIAAIGQFITGHGWKRILVVTSNYHTRRTRYICRRVLPRGTVVRVLAARDTNYDPDNWWRTRRGVKIFFHEFVGMFVAMWELRDRELQTQSMAALEGGRAGVVGLNHMHSRPVYSGLPVDYIFDYRSRSSQSTAYSGHLWGRTQMWRKPTDALPSSESSNAPNSQPAKPREDAYASSKHPTFNSSSTAPPFQAGVDAGDSRASRIGPGLKIRGEIWGNSDLYLDGEAGGQIRVGDGRVTVGPSGQVKADIEAAEIVVNGTVQGNLKAGRRLRLGASSRVQGSLVAPSVGIDDGARFHGKVEVTRTSSSAKSTAPEPASEAEMLKPVGAHTESE
jgi:cytoskeletal protein CcmA (bactofilin family)